MEIVDASGKVTYAMGVGTSQQRALQLPAEQQGTMFDMWFGMLSRLQQQSESDPAIRDAVMAFQRLRKAPDAVTAEILMYVMPLVNALLCMWTYAASDVSQLRSDLAQLGAEVAALQRRVALLRDEVEGPP